MIDFNDAAQRHDLKYPEASLIASTPAPDVELLAESDGKRVHQALNKLPEPYRTVLALREFEDLKYSQIAAGGHGHVAVIMRTQRIEKTAYRRCRRRTEK